MTELDAVNDTRTSADLVFDRLREQIVSLEILPGTRLSEVEVAKRFGLSRQPVRAAFGRLGNMGLLHVRPQRPTTVRRFSLRQIEHARFIRASVEMEVLRRACLDRDIEVDDPLRDNLARQIRSVDIGDAETFHRLDYDFHRLLCEAARVGFAFETIAAKKAETDRLCMVSLTTETAMRTLVQDHVEILDGVLAGAVDDVQRVIRLHLERLTLTLVNIHKTHRDYFDE